VRRPEVTGDGVVGAVLERRYRVDAPLARGGMSSVYSGVDLRLDRPVAIKVMEPRFAADRSFIDRFELEARAAPRIFSASGSYRRSRQASNFRVCNCVTGSPGSATM